MAAAGPWVLLLGGMRYLFVLAAFVLPWLAAPLPQRFRRKLVCVIQIGALVILLAPVVMPPVSVGLALVALALLTWSFAADVPAWTTRSFRPDADLRSPKPGPFVHTCVTTASLSWYTVAVRSAMCSEACAVPARFSKRVC